jgi:hypothetical protein
VGIDDAGDHGFSLEVNTPHVSSRDGEDKPHATDTKCFPLLHLVTQRDKLISPLGDTMQKTGTLLLAAILGVTVGLGASDPLIGTWKLNIAKSRFSGPVPQNQIRTYEMAPNGIIVTTITVDEHGKKSTNSFPAQYDGKSFAVTGIGSATEMALRKVDEKTATISLTHAGKVIATAQRVISDDGKTMTITYKGAETDPANHVSVFEKQ